LWNLLLSFVAHTQYKRGKFPWNKEIFVKEAILEQSDKSGKERKIDLIDVVSLEATLLPFLPLLSSVLR